MAFSLFTELCNHHSIQFLFGQKKAHTWPDMLADTYNPTTLGDQGARITRAQEFETSLGSIVKPHLLKKKRKEAGRGGSSL